MTDAEGHGWRLLLGDCVERIDDVDDETVGLTVFSPPFPGMYVYSDSERDMGNNRTVEELVDHYRFLIPGLLRTLMPGRSCCVHLCQTLRVKYLDGVSGIRDFRGAVIAAMESAGFVYYGEVCIDKDPQVKAIRTKDQGLLFKSLATDSARMHMALADYMLQFRKPGENPEPIRAGISDRYGNPGGWITAEEWIEWAAPVWYRASSTYPGGIRETDVLNVRVARADRDERHIAPLQLGVIERAVKLWSNPGDLVLSPFAGIGSEGRAVSDRTGIEWTGGVVRFGANEESLAGSGRADRGYGGPPLCLRPVSLRPAPSSFHRSPPSLGPRVSLPGPGRELCASSPFAPWSVRMRRILPLPRSSSGWAAWV